MANVLLIRETEIRENDTWYPWLKKELEKRGHILFVPETPEIEDLNAWKSKAQEYMKFLDQYSMVIGHGFGAKVALKILESKSRTIAATFLVAGCLDEEQYDFENIKLKSKEFFVYASDNDIKVALEKTEHLAEMLDESVLPIPEAGHFDKIDEFEDILVDIISVVDR
jgi:predicted alpha/beta hydrolase family esterase